MTASFVTEKLFDIEDKQVQLQKLRNYKSSLQISKIYGIISVDNTKYMETIYAQKEDFTA